MNVLCIGNSFSSSVLRQLPEMAAVESRELSIANLSIAGCTLDRHAENLRRAGADPAFKPYRAKCIGFHDGEFPTDEFDANANEMLARPGWDVVVVQQGSSKSWDYASYQPCGHAVVSAIRSFCPAAAVALQQTWAYRADDVCIRADGGLWGFGQEKMAELVFDACGRFAEDEEIARIIPTGRAVWLSRKRERHPFRPWPRTLLAECRWPDLPPQAGDVVGRLSWARSSETGEMEIVPDTIHLNERGQYLQALVWFGVLFDADPAGVSFVSPTVGNSDAAFLRECARDALDGHWGGERSMVGSR